MIIKNIFKAIVNRDVETLKAILQTDHEDLNKEDLYQNSYDYSSFSTPLLCAIEQIWIEGVETLIKYDADVNFGPSLEPRPIGLAVDKENIEIIKLLLEAGANPNHGGIHNFPLHDAVRNNRSDIVQILIESGVDLNQDSYDRETPLMAAVYKRNLKIVRQLIDAGAYINLVDSYDKTALSIAIENEYHEVIKYFLCLENTKNLFEKWED